MYRRRPFPIASASAMAAGELTSGNTTQTSLTFLGPSQGLADTEFRNVRSTRSVVPRRLTVRTLCMPLSVPTQSSSLRSDTPKKTPSSRLGSTLATFRDSRDHEEDLLRKMRQCWRELAPFAQLTGCLGIWTSPAPVHHRHEVLHKPSQDWVSSWKLLSKASDDASQIRSHGIFRIFHSALCQQFALRVEECTLLNLDIHTCQFHRCRC